MSDARREPPIELSLEARAALSVTALRALIVGAIALAVCVVGAFFDPFAFFRAYLVAFLFALGFAHGCLAVLMIYHLTGGAWGYLLRRPLEAGAATLPVLGLLFIPLGCGAGWLYLWAQPGAESRELLQHRLIYLNLPFFWVRAAICFLVWSGLAGLLIYWSERQDATGDPKYARRLVLLSGPGLALYGVTIMFASIDWVMSLQTAFHSSIIGPLIATGELLQGFAFVLLVFAWLHKRQPLADLASVEAIADMGNLLFTFLIIWAYMAYFQFMLIWIADLPADVIWYLPRTRGPWYVIVWVLFILHFAVPFILLLFRAVVRSPRALAWISVLLLVMHLLYLEVVILPVLPGDSVAGHWMDVPMPIGICGLWLAVALWWLGRRPVLAPNDPNRAAALNFHEHDLDEARRQEGLSHG